MLTNMSDYSKFLASNKDKHRKESSLATLPQYQRISINHHHWDNQKSVRMKMKIKTIEMNRTKCCIFFSKRTRQGRKKNEEINENNKLPTLVNGQSMKSQTSILKIFGKNGKSLSTKIKAHTFSSTWKTVFVHFHET
ncbi:hypothetical protein RFI_38898 [Reticulomyxa filosa]|uniref:Uncharacterized protein n=1 Tax=Reticulomyxa filosa TaxID=46433 RepID=X6LCW0_RETFI|nr:hypothetical protein RFI_38898 [Reticulomyxa filosa]|eukprot:ETN98594.1 hypothetical protein RFI_38898 [Reticulomyxa filosa]